MFRCRRRLSLAVIPLLGVVLAADPAARAAAVTVPAAATPVTATPPATREVARNSNGCLEAFVRDAADGTIWHIGQNEPGSNWSDWSSLGGAAASDPVIATNADGRLEVFTTAPDGGVSSLTPTTTQGACGKSWSGATWTAHQGSTPGAPGIIGAPAAATNLDGRILVVGVGKDGHLHSMRQKVAGSVYGENWSNWADLAAPTGVTLAGAPAVAMNGDGRLQVFARGSDNQIWSRAETQANSVTWGTWTVLPGLSTAAGDPAAAANENGLLQVFVRTADNALWDIAEKASYQWASWTKLTDAITGNAQVARNEDGRLEAFARGSDSAVRHLMQTQPSSTGSWGTATSLGGTLAQDPVAVANSDGRLELFGTRPNRTLWHRAQNEPGAPPGNDWSSWDGLGNGAQPCAGNGSLGCVNVVNVGSGLALTPASTDQHPDVNDQLITTGANQRWSLARNADASFQLVNHATNQCLDIHWDSSFNNMWECQGQASQKWYLEPLPANSDFYLIRQVSSDSCLTQEPPVDGTEVGYEACSSGAPQQQWRLGISAAAPGTMDLALLHGLSRCAQSTTSCNFSITDATHTAYIDTHKCVPNSVVQNGTTSTAPFTLSGNVLEGWQNLVGGSLTLTETAGVDLFGLVEEKISAAVMAQYQHSWIGSNTVTVSGTVQLAPGEYGWLEKGLLAKKVIGTWSFNGNSTWSQPGQSTVPAADGTDQQNSTATIVRSGMAPPPNC